MTATADEVRAEGVLRVYGTKAPREARSIEPGGSPAVALAVAFRGTPRFSVKEIDVSQRRSVFKASQGDDTRSGW